MINPALNKAHKPTKQLWETFGAFDSKDRNALKSGLVRQSCVRQLRSSPGERLERAQPLWLRSPASALPAGGAVIYPPRTPGLPRCSRSLHGPGLCFTLTHQQVAKLESLEKSFLRETLQIVISLPQKGEGREEVSACSLQPSPPSLQQMGIVSTPWHMRKKCRSKRDSEIVKVIHGFKLL